MSDRPATSGLAAFGLALVLALATSCSQEKPEPPTAVTTPPPAQPDPASSLPRVGGPEGYVGSANCRSCHEDEFHSWHRSYHRTMTQLASPDTVRADFNGVVLTNESVRFILKQAHQELSVRMERLNPDPLAPEESLEERIGLVTGSHHMQVFWVAGGDGNTQIGFPFTWLIPEKRWVPRNSTFIRPPDAVHRAEVWNVVCSRCHATGIEPRVDSTAHRMDTRAGELGIACEACHGPGERHAETRRRERDRPGTPSPELLAAEIVHPKKLPPDRASMVCAFCHSMKWIDRSETWRQGGFRFRPGDDLEATTPVIRPSRVDRIPGLAAFLDRSPDLLRDYFWSDGMIRVSGREYNGLIESPCHAGGKFSCLSCHSLHDSDPDDQLARNRTGDAACTQCHDRFHEESAIVAHTHHRPGSTGGACFNCHMPHTTYGVLKAIRSHQVSSPRVSDELTTGRPNACNLCHLDRSLAWTAEHLTAWYRQPAPALPPEAASTSHATQMALTGDAGQRVLIAWHLGWTPALEASGRDWVVPLLGQLLDDPYAAVRCVADRSLRSLNPGWKTDYDYVVDPRTRPPARDTVWAAWRASWKPGSRALPAGGLLSPGDLEAQGKAFEERLARRNDRPIRLRE